MKKEQDLKEIRQQSFREINRDGFNEVNLGMVFLLFFNAIYFGFPEYPSISLILRSWLGLTVIGLFIVYFIFIFLYYKAYRKKYVYPRIGYVKPQELHSLRAKLGGFAVLILVVMEEIILIYMLSTGSVTIDWVYRWIPVIFGLTACTFSLALKDRSGQSRYLLVSVLLIVTGVAVALAEVISAVMVPIIYFDGWGFTFIVLGIIKFALFIRNYPIIETPEVAHNER